jgi:hypothetical protein
MAFVSGSETLVATESVGYMKLIMFLAPPVKFFISIYKSSNKGHEHRLNMELDLQIYLGSMCTAVLIG